MYIRLRNPGNFDIVKAINLLGASVKECSNPIGLFGSGSKYALAQCLRSNIRITICCNNQKFKMVELKDNFRDKEFRVVGFQCGADIIRTSITSEFGKEDWTDTWFILREFYSNLLDEGGSLAVVDAVGDPIDGMVDVYLPYEPFQVYIEKIEDYFSSKPSGTVQVGTGRIYKRGVWVGSLEIGLDLWHDSIKITESRTMLRESAVGYLEDAISASNSVEVWEQTLKSEMALDLALYPSDRLANTIEQAMIKVHGEKYAICPKFTEIQVQCLNDGYQPVVLGYSWNFKGLKLRTYIDMVQNLGTRLLNEVESLMVEKVLKKITWITGDRKFEIVAIENGEMARYADANLKTGRIRLAKKSFTSESELMNSLIHEIGHVMSGFTDWDVRFTDFFIQRLVEVSI